LSVVVASTIYATMTVMTVFHMPPPHWRGVAMGA
jgi:hypothetical protein